MHGEEQEWNSSDTNSHKLRRQLWNSCAVGVAQYDVFKTSPQARQRRARLSFKPQVRRCGQLDLPVAKCYH